jgi:hypothetical protein
MHPTDPWAAGLQRPGQPCNNVRPDTRSVAPAFLSAASTAGVMLLELGGESVRGPCGVCMRTGMRIARYLHCHTDANLCNAVSGRAVQLQQLYLNLLSPAALSDTFDNLPQDIRRIDPIRDTQQAAGGIQDDGWAGSSGWL